jgi:hypothetical protein
MSRTPPTSQTTMSRVKQLACLKRQIDLAELQRTVYVRRATSETEPESAFEWSLRVGVADADLLRLRTEWLAIKLALCAWQARRKKKV